MNGRGVFYVAAAFIMLYAAKKAFAGVDAVGTFAEKLYKGITFDPASLGPGVQLTQGAKQEQVDYIKAGYMVMDSSGRTHITPAGEQYIKQQQTAAAMQQAINGG